jgi:hypothetical protein
MAVVAQPYEGDVCGGCQRGAVDPEPFHAPTRSRNNTVAKVTVTRRVHFNAAHRLHSPALSDSENAQIFGPCNPNSYGHNYQLNVSVTDETDPPYRICRGLGSGEAGGRRARRGCRDSLNVQVLLTR